ncbi:polyketide synthase, partial [Streptomyces leeuwenhoekii]
SGTNAHVILESYAEAPVRVPAAEAVLDTGAVVAVPVSARSTTALRALAGLLLREVDTATPADLAYSLATTRAALSHRAVITATCPGELRRGLAALAGGGSAANLVHAEPAGGSVVFVFPGQGAQWAGMALELLGAAPVFADRLLECDTAVAAHAGWSVLDVLRGVEGAPALDRVDVVQPVLFAVMVSLAALWQACGVKPAAVIGHSQGEIAAAAVAGALELDDAVRVVVLRSRALVRLAGLGGMASVALPEAELPELLRPWGEALSVAAVNGPRSTVVSGERAALAALLAACADAGIRAREIKVDYASHSPQVDLVRDEVLGALDGITPRPANIPFFSTVTGEWADTTGLDGGYWYRN